MAARFAGATGRERSGDHAHQCQKDWRGHGARRRVSQRLSQTGFTEGKDVVVEYHWLDGRYEDLAAILDDAVGRHVAVIATPANTPGSLAAKAATSTIPVVFGVSDDPVALGLVASLARPGGNVTGINFFASEIATKRLGLMHELLPKAKRVAVLLNPANASTTDAIVKALGDAAPRLGLELLYFKASTAAEIDAAFAAVVNAKADALFIAPDGYFASRGSQLATLAARDRMPSSDFVRDATVAGVLMSYGTAPRDEKGDRGPGTPVGCDHAPHMG